MSIEKINDIEMAHYGIGVNSLATVGVAPCIATVAILGQGEEAEIFIEHRDSTYLPTVFNNDTMEILFGNITKHVSVVSSESKIR